MILQRRQRICWVLCLCILFLGSEPLSAGEVSKNDFNVTLFPLKVERQNGKPVFRIKARLTYKGKSPIRLETYENLFVPPDSGFLQRSMYFGFDPQIPLCSLRQVGTDQKYPPALSRTLQPGEVFEEEWVTDGIDINGATFKNERGAIDGGVCLNHPGKYRVKVLFWASNPDDKAYGYVSAVSNEQTLEIPSS